MGRPRIVHVYKDYPPVRGGIEHHIETLCRFLVKAGFEAEVLCTRRPGTALEETRSSVRIRRCPAAFTLASTPVPLGLPQALRQARADIVHLHYPWPPGELAWLLAGRRRGLVVTVHCEVVRYPSLARLLAPLTRKVLAAAKRIVVSSAALKQIPVLIEHAERVHVIPFGVDLDRFRPDPRAADPLPEVSHPRILFTGRLRYYKGLPVLAEALRQVPRAQLVVVGDGPERAALEAALEAHGCRDRARLVGEVDDETLLALMQTSDAAVLPSTSRAEAFGLSIAEAQACGVPAVTTSVGTGTTQTVHDGVSGRVIPPNDSSALVDALTWCLDPARTAALRAAARRHAEGHFDARRMVDATCAVYEDALR